MSEQEPEVVETEEPEEAAEPEDAESLAEGAGTAYNPTVKVEENE